MNVMKLPFALALCFVLFSNASKAQENVAKFLPVGIHVMTGVPGVNTVGYYLGAGFERTFSDKLSGQINLGGAIVGGGFFLNDNRFIIKPEVAYYIQDYAPFGLYLGGYTSFGFGGLGGALVALGPQAGYQFFFLEDRLGVDVNVELGVGIYTAGGGNAGFQSLTSVAVGYAF